MLIEALDHLVRGIVNSPDDVDVRARRSRSSNPRYAQRGETLEVRVHPDDLGRVIGRAGRTATSFRTVLRAISGDSDVRIDFVDVDRPRAG